MLQPSWTEAAIKVNLKISMLGWRQQLIFCHAPFSRHTDAHLPDLAEGALMIHADCWMCPRELLTECIDIEVVNRCRQKQQTGRKSIRDHPDTDASGA